MLPKSIRWRLPLSYAGIALLATLALGAVLLTTLRGYYAMREQETMVSNAQFVGNLVGTMYAREIPQDQIDSQINVLSFVSQARIQLFDTKDNLLADSGNPTGKSIITYNFRSVAPGSIGGSASGTVSAEPGATGGDTLYIQNPSIVTTNGMIVQKYGIVGSTDQPDLTPPPDKFMVALAGSPFGVGLKADTVVEVRSGQSVTVPVLGVQSQPVGTIQISDGPAYGTEIIDGMAWALVIAGTAAVIVAAIAGWFISRTLTAPLLMLTDATAKMANGELSTRVPTTRNDEIGLLARSFDEMAQRVEATVFALRRFAADAAHQIHTPLTAVHADLELAASEPDQTRSRMFIERALAQLKRMEALTNDLLDLSRLEARAVDDRRVMVNLVALVRDISEGFASRADQAGIAFNVEAPDQPVKALVNETLFRHAIGNLLDNAIKFTPENGTITVGVRCASDQVELWVNDTGIGISEEDLPQIFDRFHRGRNASAYPGSGLGLAIIKAIVEGHNGQISVKSKTGCGTQFALRVPTGAV